MLRICSYICLLLYFMCKDIADAGIFYCAGDEDNNPSAVARIRLLAYKGNSSRFTYIESTLANPGSIRAAVLPDRNTILYIHGFMENTEADNVQIIIRAYLDKGDVNVILVDWGDVAIDINYFYVASQVAAVGKALAESLEKLVEVINLNTLHVIGHSLGAHVAGHIGRYTNVTLSRITGLDPALPLFYPSACHIKSSDAEAVVILHTDGGFYGTPIDTGSVDFYANRGISLQPGCPIIIGGELCSHQRSVKIYAESLKNPKAFPAHKCFDKIMENGKDDREVYFGDSTPKNIFGPYCFNTNAYSPYGKGT
ncbi:PREDICTED: phospholipase A1 1-like isoform X1 [Habropoda laboriosa]|uniref:phospholipase A1 1-like isoform X1 n=1 Tax=Habropoda laboriosa TaxID=597456 RepID=UPI00083CB80F|nr:PREDICTED: phospholipase A1 1-like isoform X1 [Habropoda laboriosa]